MMETSHGQPTITSRSGEYVPKMQDAVRSLPQSSQKAVDTLIFPSISNTMPIIEAPHLHHNIFKDQPPIGTHAHADTGIDS